MSKAQLADSKLEIQQNLKGLAASTEYIESETRSIAKMEEQLRALQARVDEAAQQRCQELLREQRKAIDQQASQTARVQELRLQLDLTTAHKEQAKKEMNYVRSRTKTISVEPVFEMRDLVGELSRSWRRG